MDATNSWCYLLTILPNLEYVEQSQSSCLPVFNGWKSKHPRNKWSLRWGCNIGLRFVLVQRQAL